MPVVGMPNMSYKERCKYTDDNISFITFLTSVSFEKKWMMSMK